MGDAKGKLTEQHREFCRLVVSGVSQRRAYMQVFECKPDSAGACATKLMRKAYIQEEVSRLRERVRDRERKRDDKVIWSKVERLAQLQGWAVQCAEAGEFATAVRCVAEMNKMDGAYEPEQVEVSGALGVAAVVNALQGHAPRLAR